MAPAFLINMAYYISKHLSERALERGISETIIRKILSHPEQIVDDESGQVGQKFTSQESILVKIARTWCGSSLIRRKSQTL